MYTTKAQICIRRDTAANFTSANPTLALGEIAYETDTRNLKVGDGATAWTSLPYINPYRAGTAAAPTSNTVMGSGAGDAMQAGAINNVLLGQDAGGSLTTGFMNIAIGASALAAATNGLVNVAIGQGALGLNNNANNTAVGHTAGQQTTGGNNTLIGANTGDSGTAFSHVTAIGSQAAKLNTANDTVAIGSGALDANTTGANNTAVGRNALGANTQGANNTAVGMNAGAALTTHTDNSFFGSGAGTNCTSNGNVAVGFNALNGISSGTQNVGVGYSAAGATNSNRTISVGWASFLPTTTTTDSVAIGWQSGRYVGTGTTNCTSLTNSVLLGSDARAEADSQTNQIVIGYQGRGNGSNTTTIGNSSTTDTYLAGDVTVNGDTIFGATVVAGNRIYNQIQFAGTAPELHLMASNTNLIKVGIVGTRGTVGSTNNTGLDLITSGVARLSLASNANGVTIPNGNLVIGTSGQGIDFSATPGTGTSELLADYEEGTWTVELFDSGSGGNVSATTATGYYTRIGRTVLAQFQIENINTTGMTAGNPLYFTIPFTSSSVSPVAPGAAHTTSVTLPAGYTSIVAYIVPSASRMYLRPIGSNVANAISLVSELTSGTSGFRVSIQYLV